MERAKQINMEKQLQWRVENYRVPTTLYNIASGEDNVIIVLVHYLFA